MAAVLPSHGSSSDVSCCPPLKGMHPRSSSSHGSVETEGSPLPGGDLGGLVQCVSDLMVFGPSSVLPLQEAKDVRSFCSKVDAAAVVPNAADEPDKRLEKESTVPVQLWSSGSSADPMTKDSPGLLLHSSPTSDACRSSLFGFNLSSVKTSRSGYGSYKSLVSGFFGVFIMLFFILGFHTATAITCHSLPFDATHDQLLTCTDGVVELAPFNNSYPIVDISNFTQDNFTEFARVKGGRERSFTGNLRVIESVLEYITIILRIPEGIPTFFELKRNPLLEKVELSRDEFYKGLVRLNIRGNKILSNNSLEAMKTLNFLANDSYIQDFGECDFEKNPIKALDDLQHCYYVVGDLIVNDQTDLKDSDQLHKKITKTLTSIERGGCLKIINSNLESLGFTENFKNLPCGEIEGNKNLCVHPQELMELKQRLGASVSYKDNQDCKGVCSAKYLMDEKDTTCKIVSNTLSIMGIHDSADLTHLHQVEEIRGRLVIMNNDFTDLNFFPNLETVDTTSDPGDAIEIRFNNNMTSNDFPKLKNITTTAQVLVYENEHPINPALEKRLNKDFPGKVTIVKQKEQTIINATMGNKTIDEVDPESAGAVMEAWKIALIVTAMLVALLLIIIVVSVVLILRHDKKAEGYLIALKANFKFSDAELICYPNKENLVTWMSTAKEIMEENVELIKEQEERLAALKAKDKKIIFYKNEEATAPIYSRFHKKLNDGLGKKENIYPHKLDKQNGECHEDCMLQSDDDKVAHLICQAKCEGCEDYGITDEQTKKQMFGVRMEKTDFKKWNPMDLHRPHELYFKHFLPDTIPIIYEQTFAEVTAKRMQVLPNSMVADELLFLAKIAKWHPECSIHGKQLDFPSDSAAKKAAEAKEKEAVALGLPMRASVIRFTVSLHHYTPKKNDLEEDVTKIKLEIPLLKSFFSRKKKKNSLSLKNMITAHMNVPPNRWLTNYTAENIIELCERTKKALFDSTLRKDSNEPIGYSSVINLDRLDVRIIGEIRGHFDDLRRGLCLPSVNSVKNKKDTHPICSVKHIFLGNYVGAGGSNMEVLCLLFALKCKFPKNYILLRGAMEWPEMDVLSGLKSEVTYRFPDEHEKILNAIYDVFAHLPLICRLGNNAVCVSGGLPPTSFSSVDHVELPVQTLEPDTITFNMMFALPNYTVKRFFDNVEQNAGYYFGEAAMATGADVIFCTKVLKSGFGVFDGMKGRLYSLCGYRYRNRTDYHMAQAEYNDLGELTLHVIINEEKEEEKWDPDAQFKETNEQIQSQMTQVKQLSMMGKVEAPKSKKSAEAQKSEQKPAAENAKKTEPAEKAKPVPKTNETQKTEPVSKAPASQKKEASVQGGAKSAKSDNAPEAQKSSQKKEVSVQGGNKSGAQPSKK